MNRLDTMNTKRAQTDFERSGIFALLIVLLTISFATCKDVKSEKANGTETGMVDSVEISTYYQEEHRPQFHFSPETSWMNDPNGLVFKDGIYHLFYQYYPDDIVWGPMHWGHATSTDLLHWEHQSIALYPDSLGYIFSGSAVVDHGNTSGLGMGGEDPLVAIFTYHDPEKEKAKTLDHQTQGIAYSNDNGETWTKFEGNPVLPNPGKMDFRDPKVFWHEESKKWIMSLAVGDHAEFYASPDLKSWEFLSEFGQDRGAHGGVWECPDLIRMRVEGEDEHKWLLLISINPGGPNGGSATQYFVGEFDGTNFKTSQKETRWLDYGADNYAGVTYNNAPGGKQLFIGWMSNWNYAQETPAKKWRSSMTLPRELSLWKDEAGYFVRSEIIPGFEQLTQAIHQEDRIEVNGDKSLTGDFEQAEVSWNQELSQAIDIKFSNPAGEFLLLKLDPAREQVTLDRSRSGKVDFSESFADKIHTMPFSPQKAAGDIRIVLDRASIELFIDQGRYVMTEQFFTNEAFTEMNLNSANELVIEQLKIKSVAKTWNNE